jgi:hypothetical protein
MEAKHKARRKLLRKYDYYREKVILRHGIPLIISR